MAFDRASISVRSKDADGRLHVAVTAISKSNICGYQGSEIPDCEALGLDPKKVYQLYRDPEELTKAAPTFNLVQVLNRHVPVNAGEPQKQAVIGATGTDAEFDAPYLKNSMVIWDATAIRDIESGGQREISSAYYFTADMTPGDVGGEHFDGRMVSIVGNHVAIVERGRAGPDVMVGDAAIQEAIQLKQEIRHMAKKILPRAAMAARNTLSTALRGLIAQDAELSDIIDLLEVLEADPAEPAEPVTTVVPAATDDDEITTKIKAILGEAATPEMIAAITALCTPVVADDVVAEPVVKEADAVVVPPVAKSATEEAEKVTKAAMDAALKVAVQEAETKTIERLRAARTAERTVEPWVGKLAVMDSAEEILRHALKTLGVDGMEGLPVAALSAVLKAQPLPGAAANGNRIASDAALNADDFDKRFPTAKRIGRA
jgi:hypothetical protein